MAPIATTQVIQNWVEGAKTTIAPLTDGVTTGVTKAEETFNQVTSQVEASRAALTSKAAQGLAGLHQAVTDATNQVTTTTQQVVDSAATTLTQAKTSLVDATGNATQALTDWNFVLAPVQEWLLAHPIVGWILGHPLWSVGLAFLLLLVTWGLLRAVIQFSEWLGLAILQSPFQFGRWLWSKLTFQSLPGQPSPPAAFSRQEQLTQLLQKLEANRHEQDELLRQMKKLLEQKP